MSKYNKKGAPTARKQGPVTPMTTVGTTKTYEGGNALVRDQKSELYLLAVTNMSGEDTFYESAKERDNRFVRLVQDVVRADPAWAFRMLGWLRNKANMRSASVVFAAEAIRTRLDHSIHEPFEVRWEHNGTVGTYSSKHFVLQGMARADEPGEFLAYWSSKYGKNFPMPVKRGVGLAVQELFGEYSYEKYGTNGEWTLADLLDLTHPGHKASWQADLWQHALDERHKRDKEIPESLTMLQARKRFMTIPQGDRRGLLDSPATAELMKEAGVTWEALSGWLGGPLDAKFWESLIDSGSLGYMALLRNLRNFEKAGISRAHRKAVQERLSDPEQVAKSRQFPFRFLSAYKAIESDWWGEALSDALDASVGNLPVFAGRTLVLSDTSGSMADTISNKSSVSRLEVAALFAVALARSGSNVDLYGFAGGYSVWGWNQSGTSKVCFKHELKRGGSLLKEIQSFTAREGEVGHGTELDRAFAESYKGHDRVVIVSDMQSFGSYKGDITTQCPWDVKLYGLNVAGYQGGVIDLSKRNRFEMGGFSDQIFRQMALLEAGDGNWPF